MKQTIILLYLLLCCSFMEKGSVFALAEDKEIQHGDEPAHSGDYIYFTENKNQWEDHILFKADLPGAKLYMEKNQLTYHFMDAGDLEYMHQCKHTPDCNLSGTIIQGHVFKVKFIGANKNTKVSGACTSPAYKNFYLGNKPSKWASKVSMYREVTYPNLYSGIDMRMYETEGTLKYDFIVEPNADVSDIAIEYDGPDELFLHKGELNIKTSVGTIIEKAPFAYQYINGQEKPVSCRFVLEGNKVRFDFPEGYDKSRELIIDPILLFSSYSGSSADNWGYTATYDKQERLYGGGIVFGTGYPTTTGVYDITFNNGETDIGISKFASIGDDLIYSTYLGGSSSDMPHSLIVNDDLELVIFGTTGSDDYPLTSNAYDNSFNGGSLTTVNDIDFAKGSDIIVTKLNADGTSLIGSTYLGGSSQDGLNLSNDTQINYSDHARGEVILDNSGNILITSSTSSDDFPVSNNAYQQNYGGGTTDACVAKFNPDLSDLLWATFLGGSKNDAGYGLKLENGGSVMVVGGTSSSNYPVTNNVLDDSLGGTVDGFVSRINSDGTALEASSYLGTSGYDQAFLLEIDENNDVYVIGQTDGAYTISDPSIYQVSDGHVFLHKMNIDLDLTYYSTRVGNDTYLSPTAFLVDDCQRPYISVWGGELNTAYGNAPSSSTDNLKVSENAYDKNTDGNDFYFLVLRKDAKDMEYATFFGGTSSEHVDGGTSRFDKKGTIYQAICAGCSGSFPTTPGAWAEDNGSFKCNLGVVKFSFDLSQILAEAAAEPSTTGCNPLLIHFKNTSLAANTFEWDFDNGDISNEENPSYVFKKAGTYNVRLIATHDDSDCAKPDTTYLEIIVKDPIDLDATYQADIDCDNLAVTFTPNMIKQDTLEYKWDFGDGNTSTEVSPVHQYTSPGAYNVVLTLSSVIPVECTDSDSYFEQIVIGDEVSAVTNPPNSGCIPLTVSLTNNSINASEYLWDFGDGNTSTDNLPSHTYNDAGTYEISLIASNTATCNKADTTTVVVEAYPYAEAAFIFEPTFAETNTPIILTNNSTLADTYEWDFGNGTTSTEETPALSYDTDGTYQICLTAINTEGCNDELCQEIIISTSLFIGVPNAFSPNNDGLNDVLYIEGRSGISQMEFSIFNRWGEKVFFTTNPDEGWNGDVKTENQEVEVYNYLLIAILKNGDERKLYGNITLLR